ncbi:hypothetical protein [Streptomyces yangpuensis]|uniref:hypothetical protein n=1 Tax=Streptomyces yangpuensis TaxID=1648182 RepID=UPI00069AC839|nr:hypothetical protein [Streptomyces yangpuensis]
MLMRAPQESGSWTWILDDVTGPDLEFALNAAARMSAVLEKHDLLEPHSIGWSWRHAARRGLAGDSCLSVSPSAIAGPALPDRLRSFHPQARISSIILLGSGAWFDADGERHREDRLVELFLAPDETDVWVELSVHHDVWAQCDFQGRPQPRIHANNAPRLAAALREIEQVLGVAAEPGEPTYYGCAEGYGLKAPDIIDGLGPDVSGALLG